MVLEISNLNDSVIPSHFFRGNRELGHHQRAPLCQTSPKSCFPSLADFDEQTADDWDVDMSIYYDKGIRAEPPSPGKPGNSDHAESGSSLSFFESIHAVSLNLKQRFSGLAARVAKKNRFCLLCWCSGENDGGEQAP